MIRRATASALRRLAAAVAPGRSAPARYRPRAGWQAAETGRLYGTWGTDTESINQTLRAELPLLRGRARDLVANNGYAAGFANACADNIIGPKGILLRAEVRTRAGDFAGATNDAIEEAWEGWGDPRTCDVARRLSWLDVQRLVARTVAIDGECFVRLHPAFRNAYGFALQVLDTDLVDDTYNVKQAPGQNMVVMGVELDEWGGAVAYHVLEKHPAETAWRDRKRIRIPADEILHLFVSQRAGQVRGVPWLAPVLTDAKMLDGFEEAELVAARTAATQMGILVPGPDADIDPNAPPATEFQAEPGQFREVPPGYSLEQWNPTHPNVAFAEFCNAILRCIGRGAGPSVSYMTLTGDLSQANYSSMRAGQGPERDAWRALHHWIVPRLHRPVYRAWLPDALLAGMVAVDSRLASNYQAVSWKPRGWHSVDPLKDVQTWERRIRLGVGSRTRMLAEEGEDYEAIVDELADEDRYADAEGVDIGGVDAAVPAPPPASAPARDDDAAADAVLPMRRPAARVARTLRRLSA